MKDIPRNRKTPEQLEEDKKKKEQQSILSKKDGRDIAETFGTDAGRRALKWIMTRCKYQSPITWTDGSKIHEGNLVHNAALQGLYLAIRTHVDKETLALVEVYGLEEDNTEEKGQ